MRCKILIFASLLLLYSCTQANSYNITIGSLNLSDSYVYPYRISLNEDGGIPGGGLAECSEHVGLNAIAHTTIKGKPEYVIVEWQHLVSNKTYRAKAMLDKRTTEWLKNPPFNNSGQKQDKAVPALVVEWRGNNKVAVMLVADFTRFSKGTIDLGEAAGKEIPKPNWGPSHFSTYESIQSSGSDYKPGALWNYERNLDQNLTAIQRFGCPRLPNGNIDMAKLPPEKLPFFIGKHGEHIPCTEYFCADKEGLIQKLKPLGRQRYPEGKPSPPYVFQDAPNPRPAW